MSRKIKVSVVGFTPFYEEDDPAYYLGHISQAKHDKAKEEDEELLGSTIVIEVETGNESPTKEEVEATLLNHIKGKMKAGELTDISISDYGFEVIND